MENLAVTIIERFVRDYKQSRNERKVEKEETDDVYLLTIQRTHVS